MDAPVTFTIDGHYRDPLVLLDLCFTPVAFTIDGHYSEPLVLLDLCFTRQNHDSFRRWLCLMKLKYLCALHSLS